MTRLLLPCVLLVGLCETREPLDCTRPGKPACIDVATDLADGVWSAEEQWLLYGKCSGPSTGSTKDGVWVSASNHGVCADTNYFDRSGALVATYGCCDNTCVATGIETPAKIGAPRDLCVEARANLVPAGTMVRGVDAIELRFADGGVITFERVHRNQVRWLLGPGAYVFVERDGGEMGFELVDGVHEPHAFDGGTAFRYDTRYGQHVIARRRPAVVVLDFAPGFERADGGSVIGGGRDGGPSLPGVAR
ncbi:MAG: hypothetical protein QM817_33025 [Archangium sp.]